MERQINQELWKSGILGLKTSAEGTKALRFPLALTEDVRTRIVKHMLIFGIVCLLIGVALLLWRFPRLLGKPLRRYRWDRRLGNFVLLLVVAILFFMGARGIYFGLILSGT